MPPLALRGMVAPLLASSTILCPSATLTHSALPCLHFTSPPPHTTPRPYPRPFSRPLSTTPPPSSPTPPSTTSSPPSPTPSSHPTTVYMWGQGKAIFSDKVHREDNLKAAPYSSPSPSSPLTSLSFGEHHFALLTQDGSVYTAGQGKYSELGYDSKGQLTPRKVPNLPPCISVHCGEWHTAALAADGSVWTWGWGGSMFSPNALGHGKKKTCTQPTRVTALKDAVKQLAVGKQHCLALTQQGEVYSWGRGEFGRLGLGGSGNQLSPTRIDALTGSELRVRSIVCGSSFNAAVLESGGLMTWGRNEAGQLGLGVGLTLDAYSMESVPSRVEFDYETAGAMEEPVVVRSVTAGHRHMLALTDRGEVYLFGMRMWMKPVRVRGDNGELMRVRFKDVGAGKNWSAAVDVDGCLWTWGKGGTACLGNSQDRKDVKEPTKVRGFGPKGQNGRAEKVIAGGWMEKIAVIART